MFLDTIHLRVQSGSGGNGCESYKYRTDRKTVPDGGDGGRGGRIIFRADNNAPPLSRFRFRQHIVAEGGGHGGSNRRHGKHGRDTEVLVPVGTRIYDRKRRFLIRDLAEEGEQVVVVDGGPGGVGNQGAKDASPGVPGKELDIELVFRIHAEVFLVGLPNSGKTTLLNRLTGAHGKAEPYPFASSSPEVGVLFFSEYEKIMLCDLPSVYDGSMEGRGHGARFLAHLENARLVCYVLEPDSQFAGSLGEGLKILRGQLSQFRKEFLDIPGVVLVNKADDVLVREKRESERFDPGIPVFYVSARTGQGLEEVEVFFRKRFIERYS